MSFKKTVRQLLPKRAIGVAEETYRKGRIYSLQAKNGFPAKGLRIIGVTGTNGKTTTCMYINEVLKAAGHKTAVYTTAVIEMSGQSKANLTHRTLPLTAQLIRFFKEAKQKKVDFVILEITSQALDQHKLTGVPIEVAVMTNLTQDHLDYHGTMERYAAAKARLFNNYMKPKYCVLNSDDEWFDYFAKESVGKVVSYGQAQTAEQQISHVQLTKNGGQWQLKNPQATLNLATSLAGEFNVYNATAAAVVGLTLGLTGEAVANGVQALSLVPGRMEAVDAGQPFTVWVDYAVTADALEKVLIAGHTAASGKVHIVFGATGDRDKDKRPSMGEIVAKNADAIYLTDDETYTEDPEAIRQAVYAGVKSAGGEAKTKVIDDRKTAIQTAFAAAKPGDVVILSGIGHQDSRNMGGKNIPWDERAIARELLKNSTKSKAR